MSICPLAAQGSLAPKRGVTLSRRNRAPARHLCAPCRCENAFRLPGGGVWWTRQTDPAKGIVFGDQFVLFRPPTPDAQPQAASSALTPVSRAGAVARPRPRPSFWLAGRSLVDGGIVIDVEAQALASPTSTGLVWVRTEGSSEGDAAATNHARRTRKVRFTCNLCGTQNTKRVNPHAWQAGSVFARCSGCQGVHKLQDNLEVFFETGHAPFPPPELRQSVLGSELLERAARIWQENLRN
ncbi:hypothetical protein ACKKBF_B17265 [Auxenochlorella protothecoides x Auxenochlorella symbiontica]